MSTETTERRKCKKCNRGILDTRAKRGPLVKLLFFWLPLKRYRCDYCNRKTYVLDSSSSIRKPKQADLQML